MPRNLRTLLVLTAVVVVALGMGRVPGPDPLVRHASQDQLPAGFALGLWHGIIIWVSFVWSLFDPRVCVYEVRNVGWAYNLGFVLGAASFHGGGATLVRRRRRYID